MHCPPLTGIPSLLTHTYTKGIKLNNIKRHQTEVNYSSNNYYLDGLLTEAHLLVFDPRVGEIVILTSKSNLKHVPRLEHLSGVEYIFTVCICIYNIYKETGGEREREI